MTTQGSAENFFEELREQRISKSGTNDDLFYHGAYVDGTHAVSLLKPDSFKQILTNFSMFPRPKSNNDVLMEIFGVGLFTAETIEWKHQRLILTPIFHFSQLKNYEPLFLNLIDNFLSELQQKAAPDKSFGVLGGVELKNLSLSVVLEAAFRNDKDFDVFKLQQLFNEMMDSFITWFVFAMCFGSTLTRILPIPWSLLGCRSIYVVRDEINKHCMESIRNHRQRWKKKMFEKIEDGGLIEAFLDADEASGTRFSDEVIRDNILLFLFAGRDTTANLLTSTLQVIAQYPEVQRKLQQEADQVLNPTTSKAKFDQLKYTTAVLKEVLRHYPIAFKIDREAAEDCYIEDKFIPAGTKVLLWPILSHMNPKYWESPEKFIPERFLPEEDKSTLNDSPLTTMKSSLKVRRHPFAFFPFSAGPRNCIGRNFALREATLTIACIVKRYDIEIVQKGLLVSESILGGHSAKVRFVPRTLV